MLKYDFHIKPEEMFPGQLYSLFPVNIKKQRDNIPDEYFIKLVNENQLKKMYEEGLLEGEAYAYCKNRYHREPAGKIVFAYV